MTHIRRLQQQILHIIPRHLSICRIPKKAFVYYSEYNNIF